MKVVLLQARVANDPMLGHELQCFRVRTGLEERSLSAVNLASDPASSWRVLDYDAVLVGGSGDFSVVTSGYAWEEPMLDLVREIVLKERPMFASCFGFQVLVKALGGDVGSPQRCAEIGTHRVTLTEAGAQDVVFGGLPQCFDANFGHNDSALRLPETLVHLASSEACLYQAVRVKNAPIWATQFHPELTDVDNTTRYLRYLNAYSPELTRDQAIKRAQKIHRPTPESNGVLKRFFEVLSH